MAINIENMKVGIVGTGAIVHDCLFALEQIDEIEVAAIWSLKKDIKVGKQLALDHKIKKVYTNYEKMLADKEINTVYIGIVNSFHYSYAKLALLAGKHVICEKPFTSNIKEAVDLASIAKERKLLLFEAINLLFLPNYLYVKKQVKFLEDIKIARFNYSQYSKRYNNYLEGNIPMVFNSKYSGGALMDINIYNIHFAVGLFGKPSRTHYYYNKGHNGIDTSGICILEYDTFIVECCGSKDSMGVSEAIIQGKNGYILIEDKPNTLNSVKLFIDGKLQIVNYNKFPHRLINEFEVFNEYLINEDYSKCYDYLNHSLSVMEIVTSARKQAGIIFHSDL